MEKYQVPSRSIDGEWEPPRSRALGGLRPPPRVAEGQGFIYLGAIWYNRPIIFRATGPPFPLSAIVNEI